jgi:glycosyltransferase involved in cell wall biosynthesis
MASGALGGGADHLVGLLPALVARGWECRAAVGEDGPLPERLEAVGIGTDRVRLMTRRADLHAPSRIAAAVASIRPDLVHLHGTRAAFFGSLARLGRRRMPPLVYTAHGLSFRKPLGPAGRLTFGLAEAIACRAAAHVISVSRRDLDDLVDMRLVRAEHASHVANGVDVSRFSGGDRSAARRRLGFDDGIYLVGTVSRLVPQKAVADLVEALDACPSAHLVIVGDGPERAALERRAARLGERVRFLGARQDVPDILPALDVFALSSRWEGEPIALLEALAAGLPCVATETAGAREILSSGTGVLTPIGDCRALGTALDRLARDAARRRAMGEAGRRRVAGRSWAGVATRVAAIYGRLIATETS